MYFFEADDFAVFLGFWDAIWSATSAFGGKHQELQEDEENLSF